MVVDVFVVVVVVIDVISVCIFDVIVVVVKRHELGTFTRAL